ncbi:MAG: IS3 family transposase [Kiritimatiellae bacterium]|jgi:putative transposase|nr:IS3 family transposase [Kiritimatiellia bacterium]
MRVKISIISLCGKTDMTPQNFYKGKKQRSRQEVDANLIEDLVKQERALQPRLGGRKLYKMLKHHFDEAGVHIGRDRFFEVLKDKGLLVDPLPKSPRTTNSYHSLPVYMNEFKKMELSGPNQAWVSDITYVRTSEGFLYLSLITDAYSRKIVGFHAGDTLETIGCLNALRNALGELPEGVCPLHHSDRGSQYCSHLYTKELLARGLRISMTEELHCYENALAERVNGILKQEYYIGACFKTKRQAIKAIKQAVMLYNTRRPHTALEYETPAEVHNKPA